MKTNTKSLAAAAIAGIFAASSIASAAVHTGFGKVNAEKEGCSGKDGCKGKDKKDKDACSGKDGCNGKDKKEGQIL